MNYWKRFEVRYRLFIKLKSRKNIQNGKEFGEVTYFRNDKYGLWLGIEEKLRQFFIENNVIYFKIVILKQVQEESIIRKQLVNF